MSRILVEYKPDISAIGVNVIENNFPASMEAIDGSSKQYDLEILMTDIGDILPIEDKQLLQAMLDEEPPVEYIEL